MIKPAVSVSIAASASQYRRRRSRSCVSLASQTNRRRWEIRGACTARACAFAWSPSAVVAEQKAGVGDVVVDVVKDPFGPYRVERPAAP